MSFKKALKHTTGLEGGFSNHPSDSGGATRYGITEALARAYGYKGDMKDLPFDLAADIYKQEFWDMLNLDRIDEISEEIALEMFDTSVNVGWNVAGRFLQRSLNVLNIKQKIYKDLLVDGLIGNKSVNALILHVKHRKNTEVLYKMLNSLQGNYYIELAERREKDEDFIYGWFTNRVD